MPSFWSFFGFVGSLHLSSARVRTSGRDLLLPFAVHLASVACRKSALLGRRDATVRLRAQPDGSLSSLLDELELRVVRVGESELTCTGFGTLDRWRPLPSLV